MNVDAAKAHIKQHGFLDLTPEVSRNAIRWLDGEVHAGRLVKTATGYGQNFRNWKQRFNKPEFYIAAPKKS